MPPITAILIGAGQRGTIYCHHALQHPDQLQIIGVAEPDATRRKDFQQAHGIADENCFDTWENVFTKEKWADVAIICTQDDMHYAPGMAAIDRGYDILLEKPISPSPQECEDMAKAAKEKNVKVVVCHVLRYTNFFSTIKRVIDSGEIGKVVTMVHNENVGDYHYSHSYVRGNWSKSETSSPMILAKSCHDADIMQWLIGKPCVRLSSFGSLTYFTGDNCPKDAPPRCTDGCKENCTYDARKLYLNNDNEWFRSVAVGHANPTEEEVEQALKTGPYGRCVYQCDNNVVDHQVVSMEFEDGITAVFTMSAFTPEIYRSIKIMGTKGQIEASEIDNVVTVTDFVSRTGKEVALGWADGGHGGGDTGIMNSFIGYINGEASDAISEIGISAKNHMICFAAEESRLNNGAVIEL